MRAHMTCMDRLRILTVMFSLLLALLAVEAGAAELKDVEAATVFIQSQYRPVHVQNPTPEQLVTSSGTGLIVADEGLILTNAHVVKTVQLTDTRNGGPATDQTPFVHRRTLVLHKVRVRVDSGTEHSRVLPASVLATVYPDFLTDLALLRVYPRDRLPAVTLADAASARQLKRGERVRSLGFPQAVNFGNPNGPELVLHSGDIASIHKDDQNRVVSINHDAKIDQGNSGGPLIDARGRVVGVNTFGIGKQNFSIPMSTVWRVFGDTLKHRVPPADSRRVLTVGPDARATAKTVEEAMEMAEPGDTILLGEGRHELDGGAWVKRGVWLRGASRDRTTLVLGQGPLVFESQDPIRAAVLKIGRAGYSEVSDLTMTLKHRGVRGAKWPYVECLGSRETFLHDVTIERNGDDKAWLLAVRSDNAPNIVNCRLESPTWPGRALFVLAPHLKGQLRAAPGQGPKFHRVQLSGAKVTRRAAFHGCVIRPLTDKVAGDTSWMLLFFDASGAKGLEMVGCLRPPGSAKEAHNGMAFSHGRLEANTFCFEKFWAIWLRGWPEAEID
ncbi:MAG: serine protease, partial [Phycisphaeraceae bacterium]|nr:serine protease [Phycisphaeraceae bacterium]